MTPFRVLVVDDSAFMRKIISDLIERDELFTVVGTATNGRDAIEQMKELDPDVITLDVEMPVMNGLDALKIMMQEGPRPVIMLSGINEQGMKETILALESGAFDFIRKPSITNAMDIEQVRQELMKQLHVAMQAKARRAQWEEEERLRAEAGRADAKEAKHAPPAAKTTFPLTKPSDLSSGGQSGMKQAKPKASSAAKPERSGKPERAEKKLPEPKEFKSGCKNFRHPSRLKSEGLLRAASLQFKSSAAFRMPDARTCRSRLLLRQRLRISPAWLPSAARQEVLGP